MAVPGGVGLVDREVGEILHPYLLMSLRDMSN